MSKRTTTKGLTGPLLSSTGLLELDTADGIARRFKLSPFTVRRLGYTKKIREYRCGRAVRYAPGEVMNWMASGTEAHE